jgi:hypothetical protein
MIFAVYDSRMRQPKASSRVLGLFRIGSYIFSGACLLLVLTNAIAAGVLARRASKAIKVYPEYMHEALAIAYPDLSHSERAEFMRERSPSTTLEVLAQPHEAETSGTFVNVDSHGFRLGANQGPWPLSDEFFNVFVFGSSTAFGFGVADRDTISSYLQIELARLGLPKEPRTYNFGRAAFYSTPERLLFAKLLAFETAPDLAIFVDGMSEFFNQSDPPPWTLTATRAVSDRLAHPWRTALNTLALVRLRTQLVTRRVPLATLAGVQADHRFAPSDDPAMHNRVIDRYVSNKRITEALAAAYGVEATFVWQPTPTYRYDLRHHLFKGDFGHHQSSGHGYPRMAEFVRDQPLGENFLWCADIQEGVKEMLYVDSVHYAPRLSRRLARCIVDLLAERQLLPDPLARDSSIHAAERRPSS